VADSLRPGWSDNELLTPERFREIVSVVRKKRCAVVVLLDLFDFHGSLLYNLPRVVGDNPVLIAANKVDLLPAGMSEERVKAWIKQELERIGVKDASTRSIFLISSKTGAGVRPLLRQMKTLGRFRKRDLYVIGAANVGKSTFINRLIEVGRSGGGGGGGKAGPKKKRNPGKEAAGLVTTSPLPGTTLNFIEVDLGDKVSLFDTPGLIIPHQLTTILTTEELRAVIPQKRVNHVTLRLSEGKSVWLGGLVRLDMVAGRPFLFTFYLSNEVKLHQTATERADEFLQKHVGDLVFPPFSAERVAEIGPLVPRELEVQGNGWKTSAVDIVISGLGWVSVTGALNCTVRVMAPESVGVRLREPLMPYETWDTTARWTGLRAIKSNSKKGGSR
jgi:30S ribosome assembly GTPase